MPKDKKHKVKSKPKKEKSVKKVKRTNKKNNVVHQAPPPMVFNPYMNMQQSTPLDQSLLNMIKANLNYQPQSIQQQVQQQQVEQKQQQTQPQSQPQPQPQPQPPIETPSKPPTQIPLQPQVKSQTQPKPKPISVKSTFKATSSDTQPPFKQSTQQKFTTTTTNPPDISNIEQPPFKEIINESQQPNEQVQEIHNISKPEIKKVANKIRTRTKDWNHDKPTLEKLMTSRKSKFVDSNNIKANVDKTPPGKVNVWGDLLLPAAAAIATPIALSLGQGIPIGQAIESTVYGAISGAVGNRVAEALGGGNEAQLIGSVIGAAAGARSRKHINKGLLHAGNKVTEMRNYWYNMNRYDSLGNLRTNMQYAREAGTLPQILPQETSMISSNRPINNDLAITIRQRPQQVRAGAYDHVHEDITGHGLGGGPPLNVLGTQYIPSATHPNANRKVGQPLQTYSNPAEHDNLASVRAELKRLGGLIYDNKNNAVKKTPAQLKTIRTNIKEGKVQEKLLMQALGIEIPKLGRPPGAKSKKDE